MENEFLIRFGGETHIRVETLTDFLDRYRFLLYRINNNLGYSDKDLIVEVYPPENGSFKIRIVPKYENQLLNTLSGIVAGTLSGLILTWVLSTGNKFSIEDVEKIVETITSKEKEAITKNVYNIYQNFDVKQTINQTFEIVARDENIQSLGITQNGNEIINIPKIEFSKFIKPQSELIEEVSEREKLNIETISLIIKTVHFEGAAKWAFIWRGYPIKACIKDESFLNKLNSESFKRGDILQVRLRKRSIFSEDLNTFIVDETGYEILEVLQHTSRLENENGSLKLY